MMGNFERIVWWPSGKTVGGAVGGTVGRAVRGTVGRAEVWSALSFFFYFLVSLGFFCGCSLGFSGGWSLGCSCWRGCGWDCRRGCDLIYIMICDLWSVNTNGRVCEDSGLWRCWQVSRYIVMLYSRIWQPLHSPFLEWCRSRPQSSLEPLPDDGAASWCRLWVTRRGCTRPGWCRGPGKALYVSDDTSTTIKARIHCVF